MRSVWVTGARGFIGRHVARRLATRGARVAGLGHGAWTESDRAAWGMALWANGDVTHANLDALAQAAGLPDAIIHLAGGSAVGPSFQQPAEDFRRSVASASELMEWVRLRAPDTQVVMASSAAVYGAGHDAPITESARCTPYSPYGFHKRMAELAIESYAHGFGLRAAIVRLFSVYGDGLRKQLLWDACVRLSGAQGPLELGGTGREQRDWLHVEDAARLLTEAIDWADADVPIVNGGTGIGAPIADIARHLCDCWGHTAGYRFSGQSRSGDPQALVADTTILRARGFDPEHTWSTGIRAYVAWYKRDAAVPIEQR